MIKVTVISQTCANSNIKEVLREQGKMKTENFAFAQVNTHTNNIQFSHMSLELQYICVYIYI